MTIDLPLTASEAATKLRTGQVTSAELTSALLARTDLLDPKTGTFVTRLDNSAMASAEQADKDFANGIDKGPYQGIPIGIKDILAMAEGPTTANSLILDRAWGAGKDGPVVARLKAAGAVITGKLTTSEFAIGSPDPSKPFPLPRNPGTFDDLREARAPEREMGSRPASSSPGSAPTRGGASVAPRPGMASRG